MLLALLESYIEQIMDKMKTIKVLKKVTQPTEWCHTIMPVEQSDNHLRSCTEKKGKPPQNMNCISERNTC